MMKYVKDFCLRGMLFAWGGPVVLAIVWLCLQSAGVMTMISINEAALGIVSTTIMAFVAAGISIVHQIEQLPKQMAALIQMAVIYVDYLAFYLINGWITVNEIVIFTITFLVVFAIIWLTVYFSIKRKVNHINMQMKS